LYDWLKNSAIWWLVDSFFTKLIMKKIVIFLLVFVSFQPNLMAQTLDSTLLIFFNDDFGKTPIIKENGKVITVWVGKEKVRLTGNLEILSDSSILVGADTVFLSQINGVSDAKKSRLGGGLFVVLVGASATGLGFVFVNGINNFVDGNLGLLLLALPAYALAGAMVVGGAIVAVVGLVTTISGAPRKVKLKMMPKVKYRFQMALHSLSKPPAI